jgi:hypothetical protein
LQEAKSISATKATLPQTSTHIPLTASPLASVDDVASPTDSMSRDEYEEELILQEKEWHESLANEAREREEKFEVLMYGMEEQHAKLIEDAKDYAVEFPQAAMRGSLAELAHILFAETEVPVEFGFMSAVTMFGSVVSSQLRLEGDGLKTRPNLYTVLVAPTGGKKSTAVTKIAEFFRDCNLVTREDADVTKVLQFPKAGSGEGLLRLFSTFIRDNGNVRTDRKRVLLTPDEFQELLHKCRTENSTLAPELTSLFDGSVAGNVTKDSKILVEDANLSLVGCITTKLWHETWAQGTERSLGLLNRLFLVSSLPKKPIFSPPLPNKEQLDNVRAQMTRQAEEILRQEKVLPITNEAMEEFQHFYYSLKRSMEESTRLDTIVKRLAMILAVTNNRKSIDLAVARMAVMLGQYQFQVRQLLNPSEAQNAIAQCEHKIRTFLKSKAKEKPNEWFTANRIADRTRLQNLLGTGAILRALENLIKVGIIDVEGNDSKRKYKLAAEDAGN